MLVVADALPTDEVLEGQLGPPLRTPRDFGTLGVPRRAVARRGECSGVRDVLVERETTGADQRLTVGCRPNRAPTSCAAPDFLHTRLTSIAMGVLYVDRLRNVRFAAYSERR